jgi:hypothetical protein
MSKDMKLIMERFRKNLNEMPVGAGMPLNIGAATAGGKMEKRKQRSVIRNAKFIMKLERLGDKPQFIEIEPGDLVEAGGTQLYYPDLVKKLNQEITDPKMTGRFGIQNNNLMYTKEVPGVSPFVSRIVPAKVSPAEVADLLKIVLGKMGLWTKIKLSQDQEVELRKDVDKLSKDRM